MIVLWDKKHAKRKRRKIHSAVNFREVASGGQICMSATVQGNKIKIKKSAQLFDRMKKKMKE